MKKHLSKSTLIVIIVSTVIVAIVLIPVALCVFPMQYRSIYTTYTGKYVTVWKDNYIVFDKYESHRTPKENYIKLNYNNSYRGEVDVFFKKHDSILIYRGSEDKNSIDVVFDQNVYNVEVFYDTWEDIQEFKRRTSYKDTLVLSEYFFHENRGLLWPAFVEFIGDSMYIRDYPVDRKHFFFFTMDLYEHTDSVFSRFDESFDKRLF